MRWHELECSGVPITAFPVSSLRKPSLITHMLAFWRYLILHRIQIVHTFDAASSVFAVPAARLAHVPVTLEGQLRYRALVPWNLRFVLPIVDRLCTGVVVNCKAVREDLERHWNVPRSKIHICYNGLAPERFHSIDRRRPPAVSGASVVIGTVTVLRPEKDLGCLIQAFAHLLKSQPDARLVVVGDGPMRQPLEEQSRNLGLASDVIFTGAQADPSTWMAAMDIYVNCSTSESSSNSLLEAMACGCLPVASDVGGAREMLTDNTGLICGALFKPGCPRMLANILQQYSSDTGNRLNLASAARRRALGDFTIERSVEGLARLYRNLLESRTNHQDTRPTETV
ncbi:MAG: glycosyltransferase family 4 protein [Acidobacteriaceae bacterium]|nr:glycosyltransferase family 4 protein [Acidobacteriaceae bacterium]